MYSLQQPYPERKRGVLWKLMPTPPTAGFTYRKFVFLIAEPGRALRYANTGGLGAAVLWKECEVELRPQK